MRKSANVSHRVADILHMRLHTRATVTLGAIAFLIAISFLGRTNAVYSTGRFDSTHDDIACTDCHTLRADIGGGSLSGLTFRKECERCHAAKLTNGSGIPLNFHQGREKGCSECHSFHKTEKIAVAGNQFRVNFENSFQRAQCYSCHGPSEQLARLSPGHQAAAEIYHSDVKLLGRLSSSETCLICHSDSRSPDSESLKRLVRQAPRFDEHGNHPVGIQVIPGQGEPGNKIRTELDPRIRLFNGRMECQTCHCLSTGKRYNLVTFSTQKDLCEACHQVN